MAEILSREKELFNINQELNLMALNPAEDGSHAVTQSRYSTYLKQKGPSTLLKKKMNVDGGSGSARTTARRGHKGSRALRSPIKSAATTPTTLTPPSTQVTTPRCKPTTTLMSQLNKSKMPDWRLGKAQTKQAPTTNNNSNNSNNNNNINNNNNANNNGGAQQPAGRIDSTFTRRASHKTATYVKYRNPNFKQSPSLDILLRHGDGLDAQQQPAVELEVVQQTRESTTVVNGQSKKQLTQDNFIRFLKAKVTILEEDHGQLTQDMTDQKERLEQALDALRKAESQRDQALNSNVKLSEQLHRLELQSEEANRRQKERQVEYNNQQHELELLRRDTKMLKQTNANLENRLIRASEDAETSRQMLSQQASQQRDDLEYNRKELKLRDGRIKALKRQRADLLNAYKKQLFMIDNLKRQNSCVEQAVAIGFGEKEFSKVLDWNAGSKAVF
ncbi:myb-like protein I [Drosophila montana]|uniref:myb-like protein I n=1 Tax=Drosophila montana TaxID=40370 RepID=UPI00313C74CE